MFKYNDIQKITLETFMHICKSFVIPEECYVGTILHAPSNTYFVFFMSTALPTKFVISDFPFSSREEASKSALYLTEHILSLRAGGVCSPTASVTNEFVN